LVLMAIVSIAPENCRYFPKLLNLGSDRRTYRPPLAEGRDGLRRDFDQATVSGNHRCIFPGCDRLP
jgi:hypothetical protein